VNGSHANVGKRISRLSCGKPYPIRLSNTCHVDQPTNMLVITQRETVWQSGRVVPDSETCKSATIQSIDGATYRQIAKNNIVGMEMYQSLYDSFACIRDRSDCIHAQRVGFRCAISLEHGALSNGIAQGPVARRGVDVHGCVVSVVEQVAQHMWIGWKPLQYIEHHTSSFFGQ
jgi:hypothetical protein